MDRSRLNPRERCDETTRCAPSRCADRQAAAEDPLGSHCAHAEHPGNAAGAAGAAHFAGNAARRDGCRFRIGARHQQTCSCRRHCATSGPLGGSGPGGCANCAQVRVECTGTLGREVCKQAPSAGRRHSCSHFGTANPVILASPSEPSAASRGLWAAPRPACFGSAGRKKDGDPGGGAPPKG